MDEKTMGFNEDQFKKLGMAEAMTPELKEKMRQQVPVIEHAFSKDYDGVKADLTIHLKKSLESNRYFINNFELSAQKPGEVERKQTFYVDNKRREDQQPGVEQKEKAADNFTLKKAFNFLSGRPVYHPESQSWEQINLSRKLDNGNFASQRFDKKYGFDLEKTVDAYSLANAAYKASLIESLQRGNLQKEKFTNKEGKVEELFVTPSIRTGSLMLFDADKRTVSLEQQIERQLIGKELGQKLTELFESRKTQSGENAQLAVAKVEKIQDPVKKKATPAREEKEPKKSAKQKVK